VSRSTVFAVAAAIALGTAVHVRSQAPAEATSPIEALQLIKAGNQKIIDQQDATLKRLDEVEKEAQQLRILARRV
jgi:Spy/CpxP family protein refolding chaperone